MPKKLYQLNDFSGGLNTVKDIADISDNEVGSAISVMFNTYGGIQPPYIMSDDTNNRIVAYNNTNIAVVEPGYGLGYFETDWQLGGSGTVTVATADQTGGSEDGFQYNASNNELSLKVAGADVNLTSTFSIGTSLFVESSAFPRDAISSSGVGFYRVVGTNGNNLVLDRDIPLNIETTQDYWAATVTGFPAGDQIILLANPETHKVDARSVQGASWTSNAITLRSDVGNINSKVKYYRNEDAIRCCDTASDNNSIIKFYGWIQRTHFLGTNNSQESNGYVGYYEFNNDLASPSVGKVDTSSAGTSGSLAKFDTDSNTAISAGSGFNIAIATETDETGLIESGVYEFAQTFIYDGNQESLPSKYTNTLTVAEEDEFKSLSVSVATRGPFDARISGGRIYIKKVGEASEYIMLLDIDLSKGCRTKFSDEYTAWTNEELSTTGNTNSNVNITNVADLTYVTTGMRIEGSGIPSGTTISTVVAGSNLITMSQSATGSATGVTLTIGGSFYICPDRTVANNFRVKELGFITYEVINGFSSSVFSHAIGDRGEYWKDSVVSNNRTFVCNVSIKDSESGSDKATASIKKFPDRIMYSMPNRFDTFPYDNFIEAAKGDSDHYVAIDAYADRLLAFKVHSLDIINIAGDDRNWFLEESRQYQGVQHPEAVKRTQYGLIWANEQGLFLYNGSSITNLKENKISDSVWSSFVGSNTGIIYDQQESMVFIVGSMASEADAYMCDLKKGNFTLIKDFAPDVNATGITNSVDTEDNNTLVARDVGTDGGDPISIYKLNRSAVARQSTVFTTKALSFGDIHKIKKVYAVYITYKSDVALTGMFSLLEEDGTGTALSGTISASASNWAKVKLTPSSPVTCNKISLKFNSSSTDVKAYINDIAIEYRTIYKKGS